MFVQKISTRVVRVNVKHPSFRPSRSFFAKCNLFVLIVNAMLGRNLLVLNFSLRSKRFRASSSRNLGREQKIVLRREEEGRDGKDHGVCGQEHRGKTHCAWAQNLTSGQLFISGLVYKHNFDVAPSLKAKREKQTKRGQKKSLHSIADIFF